MNAIFIIFYISIILYDSLFKEAKIVSIFFNLTVLYSIIYFFTRRSEVHNHYKHLLLGIFSQSYDPTVYAKLEFEIDESLKFIKDYEQKHGVKISLTVLVCKIIAMAMKKHPNFNSAIKCGRLVTRDTIDFGVLVDVEGSNLANAKLCDIDKKTLKQLAEELSGCAKGIRTGKDKDYNNQIKKITGLPS